MDIRDFIYKFKYGILTAGLQSNNLKQTTFTVGIKKFYKFLGHPPFVAKNGEELFFNEYIYSVTFHTLEGPLSSLIFVYDNIIIVRTFDAAIGRFYNRNFPYPDFVHLWKILQNSDKQYPFYEFERITGKKSTYVPNIGDQFYIKKITVDFYPVLEQEPEIYTNALNEARIFNQFLNEKLILDLSKYDFNPRSEFFSNAHFLQYRQEIDDESDDDDDVHDLLHQLNILNAFILGRGF